MMKIRRNCPHQIAYCYVCGEKWEDYVKQHTRKNAYAHAKRTGHKVTVETGTTITYNY